MPKWPTANFCKRLVHTFKKYDNEKTTIYCITVSYVEQL